MATSKDSILERARAAGLATPAAGRDVPQGYFDKLAARIEASLPERPELAAEPEEAPNRSLWSKVRPYVYMAAMFAGVWCMLQVFHSLTGMKELEPIDSNPVLAKALATDDFMYDYVLQDLSTRDVVDDMVDAGLFDDGTFDFDAVTLPDADVADSTHILP